MTPGGLDIQDVIGIGIGAPAVMFMLWGFMTGKIVAGKTYDEERARSDRLENANLVKDSTISQQVQQISELMEVARVTQHVMGSMPTPQSAQVRHIVGAGDTP